MTTYLYQIMEDSEEEAGFCGGSTMLAIVEKAYYEANTCLCDDHIKDDLIAAVNDPKLDAALDEIAESMFVSPLNESDLRAYLGGLDQFEEAELFTEDMAGEEY